MRTRICAQCQAEYRPNNGKQRFCGNQCRRDFQSARRREERWAERERERQQREAELREVRRKREAQFRAFMASGKLER
jgi:hypothetical protein